MFKKNYVEDSCYSHIILFLMSLGFHASFLCLKILSSYILYYFAPFNMQNVEFVEYVQFPKKHGHGYMYDTVTQTISKKV